MRTVAIVQARMGSSRLPGKVLRDLAGSSMLARVVEQTRRAQHVDDVRVATTQETADDAITEACARLDIPCHRGSENDVLDRYLQAARESDADVVVRITSDCPLIDPGVVDQVIEAFLDRPHDPPHPVDYASNTLRRTYPQGLDTEVLTREALERAGREARAPHERIHVTPYIYGHPELFRLHAVSRETGDDSHHRWTVDTEDDLRLVRALYERLGDDAFTWKEALDVLEREPELARINQHVRQKSLVEG